MKYCLASLFAVSVLGTSLHAQPPIGSYSPPVVNPNPIFSPYLNLNRSGAGAAVDYYGIVRPQIQNQKALQNLQLQQLQTAQGLQQAQAAQQATDEMSPTGSTLGGYLNYSHYFPLYSRGVGGVGTGNIRR